MQNINKSYELSMYNLDGKWNDYIGAQKEIIGVLRQKEFFESSIVINEETGMKIRITPKGIKETIGKGKGFKVYHARLRNKRCVQLEYYPN